MFLKKFKNKKKSHEILRQFYKFGFQGNLPTINKKFLAERFFNVRVGNTYTNIFQQKNGVFEGSVLSVTLHQDGGQCIRLWVNPVIRPYNCNFSVQEIRMRSICYSKLHKKTEQLGD